MTFKFVAMNEEYAQDMISNWRYEVKLSML